MARRSPPPPPTELQVEAAVGRVAIGMDGQTVAADDSLSGRMYATGRPVRARWRSEGLEMAVPLTGRGEIKGALIVGRLRERPASLQRTSRWPPASPTRSRSAS